MLHTADPGARRLTDFVLPDRYAPVRFLANGGMASVWRADDRVLGRHVAIKVLAPSFAREDAAVRRFKREARAAARLSGHPNVVTTYDIGETIPSDGAPGRAFIVMEYLAGGSLADALRIGAVTPRETVRWLSQAAAALDYAHAHGVLHRDIKLANLLLDRDHVVHVADFGIARLAAEDTLTSAGQLIGTAAYLAPEIARGEKATDASDRYSLAVAAFELLAGRRPFVAKHFAAVARQHVDDAPPRASGLNPGLPPAIDAVLARGMAKRPEDRWPTAMAFARAVDAALAPAVDDRGAGALEAAAPSLEAAAPSLEAAAPSWHAKREVRPRARGRMAAVGALAAAALGVGLAVGATHESASGPSVGGVHLSSRAQAHKPAPATATSHTHTSTAPRRHSGPPSAPANQVQAAPAAATTPPPTADTLEAHGHALMLQGDYAAAIPVLRHALQAASPGSDVFAYALYDLGRSLRLEGNPRAAIPVLAERLKIPIETGVVRHELQLALEALGQQQQQPASDGAPAPPPGVGHGRGQGNLGNLGNLGNRGGHGHGHGHGAGGNQGD